jgi:hypothetical protein
MSWGRKKRRASSRRLPQWPQLEHQRKAGTPKQEFPGCPTNACLESVVFAAFFSKTGKAAFGNAAKSIGPKSAKRFSDKSDAQQR